MNSTKEVKIHVGTDVSNLLLQIFLAHSYSTPERDSN